MTPPDFVWVKTANPPAPSWYATRILSTVWAQSVSAFSSTIPIEEEERIKTYSEEAFQAIHQLLNTEGQFFGTAVVRRYLMVLKGEFPHFRFSIEGVAYPPEEQKKPLEIAEKVFAKWTAREEVSLIALPYDAKAHHVVILIDRKEKRVEYYDPLGEIPEAISKSRGLFFNMKEEIEAIKKLFFGEEGSLYINPAAHQTCCFRCAIWGLWNIDLRLKQFAPEVIECYAPPNEEIDQFRKQTVAKKIHEHVLKELKELETKSAPPPQSHPLQSALSAWRFDEDTI